MYCGINTAIFNDIPSVSSILSAAELLSSRYPTISGAFIKYASALVQNFLAAAGSTPELDQAFSMLSQIANNSQAANQKDLETFGDILVASANGQFASDFYGIGYISYAAASIYGTLPVRILNKIANAQQYIQTDDISTTTQFSQAGAPPKFSPYGSNQLPSAGPPQFTPGGPPQFTPGGPPQFTPGGPPQFTPGGQTNMNIVYPTLPMQGGQQNSKTNALKLTEMARDALKSGNPDIALSSMFAAMNELKKGQ